MSDKTTTKASRFLFDAFDTKCGDALAKLVLLNLANRADNDGQCWPSLQRLAEDCETTSRTVIRKLEMLESMGFLKRIRRAKDGMKTSNLYRLPLSRQGFAVVTEGHIDVSDSHHDVSESHSGSDTVSLGVVTESHIKHAVETPKETPISFDDFYDAYGYKKKRGDAVKAWNKIKADQRAEIMTRLADRRFISWRDDHKERGYLPHPATWLNAEQWLDELPEPKGKREILI